MAVRRYNLNKEHYDILKAFIEEIGYPSPDINHDQMIRMHELSTMIGVHSSPGACPTCNRRAYTALNGYIHEYERIVINGEEQ
jgi:hypothetical protein